MLFGQKTLTFYYILFCIWHDSGISVSPSVNLSSIAYQQCNVRKTTGLLFYKVREIIEFPS